MANLTKNQEAYQALLQKYSKSRIAAMAGVTPQALTRWTEIPLSRVLALSDKTGIRPEKLLPEPYSQLNPTEST